jgi:hypothetical protein
MLQVEWRGREWGGGVSLFSLVLVVIVDTGVPAIPSLANRCSKSVKHRVRRKVPIADTAHPCPVVDSFERCVCDQR